jgi:two-component system phosphate regulon response regulator PhoB
MSPKEPTILAIEDEVDILDVLEHNIKRSGFRFLPALDGEAGLIIARESQPDLILLDLMLPGVDGMEVCRRLRSDSVTASIPIIMLTAKGAEEDVIEGLRNGADDFVSKPFRIQELVARIEAVLRRRGEDSRAIYTFNDVVLDIASHELTIAGERTYLTVSEFRILEMFAKRSGRAFSRDQISMHLTGQPLFQGDRSIDVHVKSIRKKLGNRRDLIETVRGVGYRLYNG